MRIVQPSLRRLEEKNLISTSTKVIPTGTTICSLPTTLARIAFMLAVGFWPHLAGRRLTPIGVNTLDSLRFWGLHKSKVSAIVDENKSRGE